MSEVELSLVAEIFGKPVCLKATAGGESGTVYTAEISKPPSLAEIIESLAGLVVPGFELRVPPPWNNLVEYQPPPITLTISDETIELTINEAVAIVDGILDVSSIGLKYNSSVQNLTLALGITLLGEKLEEIPWDPIEEPVPPVDTESARAFELDYLGLGQRMVPAAATPASMDAAMDFLMADNRDLRFDGNAGWFFGTRFTVLDTLDLDLIFWDPHLYGLAVKLRGERAGSLEGLRFEILYRKINERLGVYHADIELPTVLRRVELGAVSGTLPAAIVDIYTDGSFLIDLGFPHDLDFTRSGSIEIFPFIGQGGVYFGILPREAVPQLPAVPEPARFGPVVAVGLGVNVGVGKTVEMGVLSAGATVTMVGIFEGLIAPYVDAAGDQAGLYYRVSAQVGLIGHIYGTVNFGIVQAQIDIVALATATVTIESHRAAVVLLEASVSVHLEVRILFVTLHFSFEAVVRAEFIIGADSTAPWELPAGDRSPQLGALSATQTIEVAAGPAFAMIAPGKPVAAERVKIPLRFVPQATVGTDESGRPTVAVACMLMIDMTEPDDGPSDFGRLVDTCFSWAVDIMTDPHATIDPTDSAVELDRNALLRLRQQLGGARMGPGEESEVLPQNRLTPESVLEFWDQNFTHTLGPWTWGSVDAESDGESDAQIRHALFPMNPEHRIEVSVDGEPIHQVDFSTNKRCSPAYQRWLEKWFDELRVTTEAEVDAPPAKNTAPSDDDPTLAALFKVDYYRTILRVCVSDALNAFDSLPYQPTETDTLGDLATRFGDAAIQNTVLIDSAEPPSNEIQLDLPAGAIALPNVAGAMQAVAAELAEHGVDVPPEELVARNLDRSGLLAPGPEITQTDTLRTVGERLLSETPEPDEPTDEQLVEPIDEQVLVETVLAFITEKPTVFRANVSIGVPAISGYRPTTGQSIASIAETFSLDPVSILQTNRSTPLGPLLHIPNCDRLTVGDVRHAFTELGTIETAGAAVTRYFLHGLRLPDPDSHTGSDFNSGAVPTLKPVFELLGQQVDVPLETEGAEGDEEAPHSAARVGEWQFELGDPNSMVVVTPTAAGELGAAAVAYQALLGEPAETALQGSLTAITEDRPFLNQIRQFTLDRPVIWSDPASGEDGDGHLFHLAALPDSVRSLLDRPTAIEVRANADDDPLPFQRVTRFDFSARAVAAQTGTSRYLPGVYELGTTDPKSQADLLAALERVGEGDRMVIAYADPNGGLRSDEVSRETTALVRTNLSTVTRPPDQQPLFGTAEAEVPADEPPTLANPKRFLEVLWQGSVVNQRGLYLDYRLADGAGDSGLDVALGTDGPRTDGHRTISFLILWEQDEIQRIEPLHNGLAVPFDGADTRLTLTPALHAAASDPHDLQGITEHLDVELPEFVTANATTPNMVTAGKTITVGGNAYTIQDGDDLLIIALRLGIALEDLAHQDVAVQIHIPIGALVNVYPRWVAKRSTAAPGMLSVLATRPDPPDGVAGSVEQLVGSYNLLGLEVLENEHFVASTPGLPLGPQTTAGQDHSGQLTYRRTIAMDTLVKNAGPDNPYAEVGRTAELGFHLVDLYGNRSPRLQQLAVEIGYRDPVLNVDGWPGVDAAYAINPKSRTLEVTFAVDVGRLINMSATPPQQLASRRTDDRAQLTIAAKQLADDRIVASLWSALDPDETEQVDRSMLQTVVSDALDWVDAVSQLQRLTVEREQGGVSTLAEVADIYHVSAVALATANMDNEELLRRGAKLIVPDPAGGTVTVETGQTLADIAKTERVLLEDLIDANADRKLLASNATYTVPLHDLAPNDASGNRWYRARSRDYLSKIAERFEISVEALIRANLTMHGILVDGRPIRLPGGDLGGSVHVIDTLGALIARIEQKAGVPVDLTDLVAANEPRSRKEGFMLRDRAMLLIPPKPVAADPVPFAVGTSQDIAPLTVELTLERPAALVDRHLRSSAEVWRATSEIAPALPTPTAGESDPDGVKRLTPLAENFANAVPGWRLGRESKPHYGAGRRDVLIAVRDVPVAVEPAAAFYWPTPLVTEPFRVKISEDLPVQAVDLNLWNDRFLSAIEAALSPHLAPRLAGLDRDAFTKLLSAKRSLAKSISDRTESIIADPERQEEQRSSGRVAAAEVVHQRLLRRLDNLARQGCVIDYRRSVDEFSDRRAVTPRRLFGRAVALESQLLPNGSSKLVRPGEAKMELGGGDADGLTFEVDVMAKPGTVTSPLQWQPIGIEYDITDGVGSYEQSRWITFIVAPDPLDLGTEAVPIPSLRLPDEATMIADRLVGSAEPDASLLERRTYTYELDYRFSPLQNDLTELALAINPIGSNELVKPVADEGVQAALADVLARFTTAEERLLAGLSDEDHAETALGELATLATELASGWERLQNPPIMQTVDGAVDGAIVVEPAEDADEILAVEMGRPKGAGAVTTAVSRPLDGLVANVVAGEVTVVRNVDLVDGRSTNPEFILRSHQSRLPMGREFNARVESDIDVTTLHGDHGAAPSLDERIGAALAVLTGKGPSAAAASRPPLEIEVEASVELGPVDLRLRTPIGLWPRSDRQDLATAIAAELIAHIAEPETDGRWVLQIRVFARSTAPGGAPLVDYRRVVIPMSSVVGPD